VFSVETSEEDAMTRNNAPSTGKRVLMLVENVPYPQDNRVRNEAQTLKNAGYDVTVISPAEERQAHREMVNGVEVYRFWQSFEVHGVFGYAWEYAYSTAAIFALSLLVWMRKGFDVIHAANPPEVLVLIGIFYKLFGKRFIFDHHDLSPEMFCAGFGGTPNHPVHHILTWLERLSCRVADHVIATNESYKRIEMERGGVAEERITIVRNGPDLVRFRPVEPDPALRSHGKTVIAYIGIMGSHDGVEYLMRALQLLKRELGRSDFACVLIGKGEAVPKLKALVVEFGLQEHVRFTGWVTEAEKIRELSSAHICVDPDPWNPFNDRSTMIKIAEYMAMAKPIVAFDLTENRFTAQEAGLFVRASDELEFARALAQLMDDPVRRETMGRFGRRRVETTLAWSHSAPRLLDAYRRVLPVQGQSVYAGAQND
jgi:glycosyltransferase involved in cell wall biosynthesis